MTQNISASTTVKDYETLVNTYLATLAHKLDTSSSRYEESRVTINNVCLADTLTLADLQFVAATDEKIKKKMEEKLELDGNISAINKEFPFYERLQNAPCLALEEISLCDLQFTGKIQPVKRSVVWYGLISDEEVLKTPLRELESFSSQQKIIFSIRVNEIQQNRPDLMQREAKNKLPTLAANQKLEVSVGKICFLSAKSLTSISQKLPNNACWLIAEAELKSLDLSKFSDEQLNSLIYGSKNSKTSDHRWRLLSTSQLKEAFSRVKINPATLPTEYYRHIPLSKLSKQAIADLFSKFATPDQTNKARFELLAPKEVCKAINMLSDYHFTLLSDAQIRVLNISRLSQEQITSLFPTSAIPNEIQKKQFSLLSPPAVCHALHKFNKYQLGLLSNTQILALDVSKLSSEQVVDIFCNGKNTDELNRQKVALLSAPQVNELLQSNKLHPGFMEFLSEKQMRGLATKHLSQKQIDQLFPTFDMNNLHPGFTHKTIYVRNKLYHRFEFKFENSEDSFGSTSHCYSVSELDMILEKNKRICKQRLLALSPMQLEAIKDKLSPEILGL